jgi:proteasome lid subunit RPN8/RPN11
VKPIEACAMLFGKQLQDKAVVEKVVFAKNRLQSNKRFEIEPEKVAVAIIEAEKTGLDFIGLFHSHHAPAKPSSVDRKFMRLWGDALWLILSITSNKLAAYYLVEDKVKEATIQIELTKKLMKKI